MKPRVGILTSFTGASESYSLVNVVRVQIEMLVNSGYRPILFVSESFPYDEPGVWSGTKVEIRRVGFHHDDVETITTKLRNNTADIDVMLCHDIVFLRQNEKWGTAVRTLAKETPISWIHWQHSRGDGKEEPCENSWYAYPNNGDLEHVASLNGTTLDRVVYVPHPLDFVYLEWPDLAIQIAEDTGHPFADVAITLPTRLDRQKQIEKVVRIAAGCKKAGKSVSVIFADAFATGDRFLQYKKDVIEIAKEQNVFGEVIFLGEKYEECKYATPREVVKALFEMSNLFIQPSNAETSSLVVMEAALAGNLVIVNSDFPPIHHLYKKALTLPFGSVLQSQPTKYYRHIKTADGLTEKVEDQQLYWDDEARNMIVPVLGSQLIQSVKRQQFADRWPRRVFTDHLEPLILKAYASKAISTDIATPKRYDEEVTAIITTLDNLPMLERQVDILLDECGHVIVVNNGSKDGTREWLEHNNAPRLSYINRENLGAGPGRNAGLAMWNNSTPYTLMVDGGILPPVNAVRMLKDYLVRHPDVKVVSPEVASCFTTDESEATLIAPELPEDMPAFWQRCLSSTAFCLCTADAWVVRFSEDGPFGEPGWGVDDNDMAYRWDSHDPPIVHHDFTYEASKWMLYRRAGGSFKRIYEETGVVANQYGSVYEKRNLKVLHDWRGLHSMIYGKSGVPSVSYVIEGVKMPEFAKVIKHLHDSDPHCEIIVRDDSDPEVKWWLDTFALRWNHGDTTVDPDGKILRRGVDYPEELWSGDVVRDRDPLTNPVIITPEYVHEYIELILQTA